MTPWFLDAQSSLDKMMVLEDFDEHMEMARSLLGGYETDSDLWEANEHVNLALSMRPKEVVAWLLKSQILSSLEDDLAALATAEMAIRYAPRSAEPQYVRATVLSDMERFDEALESLERAFRQLKRSESWLLEDLYYEKAVILTALDRLAEAIATFESGLSHCPESVILRSALEPLIREQKKRSFTLLEGGRT
jgi:tetratricopeptide (TPR) repeat protein